MGAQPLKKRLAPYRRRVIEHARKKGRYPAYCLARDLADVRDYLCFERWLTRETGSETFGMSPTDPGEFDTPATVRLKYRQAAYVYFSNLEKIADLKRRNKQLAKEMQGYLSELSEPMELHIADLFLPQTKAVKPERSEA
jgi:hypothetical protein